MSDEIKNPTRIEQYLSKAAGEDTDLPDAPMTRIEQYLAKIAGQDVELPDETYTRIEEYLKTIAENGGGGGETVLINNKNISANGEYSASADDADGYKKVTVAVPNTYAAGDEGKVVSSGALVAQTAHAQVTSNGTIDTTLNNSVEVAVPLPSGTKQISITQNGTTTESVSGYASAEIDVNVSGGGGALTLLADYEVTEAVTALQIDYTNSMDGYDYYIMEFEGSMDAAGYMCPQINKTNYTEYYLSPAANTHQLRRFFVAPVLSADSSAINRWMVGAGGSTAVAISNVPLQYFYLRAYYTTTNFNVGSHFRIYGGVISSWH